jgi:hypothetical protein
MGNFEVVDPVQDAKFLAEAVPHLSLWRHRKGGEYRVVGYCTLEETVEAAVLYKRRDGTGAMWARRGSEFLDGRFERFYLGAEKEAD